MESIYIIKGEQVLYKEVECVIIKIIDINTVSIEEVKNNIIHTVYVSELSPISAIESREHELIGLTEKQWEKAQWKFEIIKPILNKPGNLDVVSMVSKEQNIGISTLYRWLKAYNTTGLVSGLADKKRSGGLGKSRLTETLDDLINTNINKIYMNESKKSAQKVINEIEIDCRKLGIKPPHPNTIRNRIKDISDEEKIRRRYGIAEARYKYEPHRGSFPGATYPRAVVQIDHTLVDIILVDEQFRKPVGRPWITVAIDIFSRMVLGFHLSFDAPGFFGTGICIANSILPKEIWLSNLGVKAEWPCWGIMDTIHTDNAKEFRGKQMEKVCKNYNINLEFRPIGKTHWGGHIERLLGTFAKEIHNLPGTTFSSVEDRKNYDSKKHASFTLKEFEKWITIFITKIYHVREHSGIKISPLDKFKLGTMGDKKNPGTGIPPRINNERRVRIDFLPQIERTVQEYGVVYNHIYYYDDVLRSFIHDQENGIKKKHVFKFNPRDISVLYFYDPIRKDYYDIPYKDTSLPPMSSYEYKEIIRKLKEHKGKIDEDGIFEAYNELNQLELISIKKTKKNKRKAKDIDYDIPANNDINVPEKSFESKNENLTPFDDIDDETFIR